jgi:hypothetical protein
MPLTLFPAWIIEQYDMEKHALNKYIHLEMRQAVWGLPQAGILAKNTSNKTGPFAYFESTNTPGLWYHKTGPITFTLVVDNFGVKYVNKDDVDHLIASIKKNYMLTEDWTGNLYCGIQLDWDYAGQTVNISMLGYIKKKLQKYRHIMPRKIQGCPYAPEPKKIGTEAQASFPQDNTPKLDKKGINRVQTIVGSILYYAQTVNMTVLMALSTIAVDQMKATKRTMERCTQLLDYLAHNTDAKVRFHAPDMILNIHSDASYLSEAKARSRACGHFFMG